MSAPDTNLETQERRHAVPLKGMMLVATFAGVLLVGLIGWTVLQSDDPDGAAVQVDGRTGAVVSVDE